MNGFLLDTNVISEPAKRAPNENVIRWLASVDEETLFLSVITLGELRQGVDLVSDRKRRARFDVFMGHLQRRFQGRILPIDGSVADRWGRFVARCRSAGRTLPAIDSLIAATALEHQLTVVTRNEADFAATGVAVLNPF